MCHLSYPFFPFVKQKTFMSLKWSVKDKKEKNETKSNINKIMTTCLLCMKKDVSSVDEKITRNDNNKLRCFILHLWDVS